MMFRIKSPSSYLLKIYFKIYIFSFFLMLPYTISYNEFFFFFDHCSAIEIFTSLSAPNFRQNFLQIVFSFNCLHKSNRFVFFPFVTLFSPIVFEYIFPALCLIRQSFQQIFKFEKSRRQGSRESVYNKKA